MRILLVLLLLVVQTYAIIDFLIGAALLAKLGQKLGLPSPPGIQIQTNVPDEILTDIVGRDYTIQRKWIGATPVSAKVYKDNGQIEYIDKGSDIGADRERKRLKEASAATKLLPAPVRAR